MRESVRIALVLAAAAMLVAGVQAQERLGSAGPAPSYAPGWTFTPMFGVAETYDDNVSLSGTGSADSLNDDRIATYFPGADLNYNGRHTNTNAEYTGSFLQYSTFSALNRWDQHGKVDVRRDETARLKWMAHANYTALPTTDVVDLGGIPFSRRGAQTATFRGGVTYAFTPRDAISSSADYQRVSFDRPEELRAFLRGGRVFEVANGWRHKIDSRTALGADYSFRRAAITGDIETFNLHSVQAAVDYEIDPLWSLSAAGGVVYLQSTPTTLASTGPAWRIALGHHRNSRTFTVHYVRSYIPSFGFGGTIQNQEAGVSYHTPLFNDRRWYFDNSATFRNDTPLTEGFQQLPLRSFRFYSTIGWVPQPWVRIEGFYARTQQTSLRPGGQVYRDRIGVQVVTSKPMRMQ
jgi:hypothetical protein